MCRIAAYLGKEQTPLSSLVLEPEHSLLVQSYAPKEMMSGVVNADGFGTGWYAPEVNSEPAVYRSNAPIWADRTFASIAPKVLSATVFAAVRSATPGLPTEESGVPPFASGPYLFAHNGAIKNFRATAMRPLRDALSDASYSELLGVTDSETTFAFLLDRLRDANASPGDADSLAETTAETVQLVSTLCAELGIYASLNLGVTDGEAMAFSRYSTEGPGNSLYFVEGGKAFPDAVVVASERLDGDVGWRQVPDQHLLVVGSGGVATRPL
jgi:gamma-glutamyl hercynylcysteine S-oxide hydrolase